MKSPVKIIAHRGNSSEAPENTRSAFVQAIDMHVDCLECDLQLTQDNIPILIHDRCFTRVTQNAHVHHVNLLPLQEIRKIDGGSWFHPDYAREKFITLQEFLNLPKGNIGMMIEVKEETFIACHLSRIVAQIIKEYVHENPSHGLLLVGSLSVEVLFCFEGYLPEQYIIPIICEKRQLKEFLPLQAKHYALHHSIADRAMIEKIKELEAEVWAWTVDDEHIAKELISHGIDGLITNRPRKMLELRNSIKY